MSKTSKTIIALDSWQIKAFLNCQEEFKLRFRENLRRIPLFKPVKAYADQGTLVHAVLANFYTLRALAPKVDRFTHGAAVINLLKKNKLAKSMGLEPEFEALLVERFQQYLFKYSTGGADFSPLNRSGIVGVEVPFSIKLYENEEVIFLLDGRIDLVSKFSNLPTPLFVDHKTQEKISNLYDRKIQFMCYSIATGYEYGMINYFGLQKKYEEGVTLRQKLIHIPSDYREFFKAYLINEVYFNLYESLVTGKFKMNLNACSGPDEKRPCDFISVCQQVLNRERQEELKKQNFEVIPAWSPWNDAKKEETQLEEVEA